MLGHRLNIGLMVSERSGVTLLGITVDMVIFPRFQFSRGTQVREFKNRAKNIIIIALLKENKKNRHYSKLREQSLNQKFAKI